MISSAELPLNARGAVYHLDLRPEELAPLVITVGDPDRVQQISQHFDAIEFRQAHREFVTHTGRLGRHRISVISTGIGMPNIDIVMNELDALTNIDLTTREIKSKFTPLTIIRLGTTGALQTEDNPGDILISRIAIGFDTLLNYYPPLSLPDLLPCHDALTMHLKGESGPFFLARASEALVQHFACLGTVGITATCGGFYGPQGRHLRLGLRYPNMINKLASFEFDGMGVINFEMESAAIMGLGQLMGHHCLSVSVVLANRQKQAFVTDVQGCIHHLIEKSLERVLHLP